MYYVDCSHLFFFFFSSRRRHTRYYSDWSSDVCSSDLGSSFSARYDPCRRAISSTATAQASAPYLTLSRFFMKMEVVGYLPLLEEAELQNKRQQAGLTLRPRWSHTLPHRCMPGAWTDAHPCVSLRSHLSRRSPTIFSSDRKSTRLN